ncbi:hypothetical protein WIW50_04695 [Flavobacteriaceae bacterium 3-367]
MKSTFSLLIIVFGFLSCVAQKGVIKGKIIAEIPEEKPLISEKVKIILNIGNKEKIVSLDQNLNFTFQHLEADTIRIRTEPHSFGRNHILIGYLKPNDTINVKLNFSLSCKYANTGSSKICPICKKEDEVIPIRYGLIAEITRKGEPAKKHTQEYKYGGCVRTGCDPNWYCKRDDNEF